MIHIYVYHIIKTNTNQMAQSKFFINFQKIDFSTLEDNFKLGQASRVKDRSSPEHGAVKGQADSQRTVQPTILDVKRTQNVG